MSKYIHVDGDDGRITIEPGCITGFYGWVYKVPNNYTLNLTLDKVENRINIYELFDDDKQTELVRSF